MTRKEWCGLFCTTLCASIKVKIHLRFWNKYGTKITGYIPRHDESWFLQAIALTFAHHAFRINIAIFRVTTLSIWWGILIDAWTDWEFVCSYCLLFVGSVGSKCLSFAFPVDSPCMAPTNRQLGNYDVILNGHDRQYLDLQSVANYFNYFPW